MMNFSVAYPELVKRAWDHGARRVARGRPHRALFNVILETHADENMLVGNGFSRRFAIAELMAYCAGWDDVAWLARFNPNIAQFSDDGHSFYGAYGPRIENAMPWLISLLKEDPETRQAVCQIYHPEDLWNESKDKPCNTMFQLQAVGGRLNMTIYQRSCDLVWGLPYDHFSFSTILLLIAHELKLRAGSVTRIIANAHVYEPEAGFAGDGRIARAMEPQEVTFWIPGPTSFFAFRNTAMLVRAKIEGIDVDVTPDMKTLMEAIGCA